MKTLKRGFVALVVIAVLALCTSFYTVKPNEAAAVLYMGRIDRVVETPGPHFHIPFLESVTTIYTGDILYDIPASDVITSDKKTMIADNYVIWTVTNPTLYFQTLGGISARAEERIEANVYNAIKNTISSMTQDDIILARGDTLTDIVTENANSDTGQYGILIKRAEIKALDLPNDNKAAVYERMISERANIAAEFTAKGESNAQKIRNTADQEAAIIEANASADAKAIIAEGEAEYMKILSEAYNDPDKAAFYTFLRGLDALGALSGEGKTIILDKESDYARLIYGAE